MKKHQKFKDPAYIQGQIASLRALVLGLSISLSSSKEFQEQSLERLQRLKTALLDEPVSDAMLEAVDDFEDWVREITK